MKRLTGIPGLPDSPQITSPPWTNERMSRHFGAVVAFEQQCTEPDCAERLRINAPWLPKCRDDSHYYGGSLIAESMHLADANFIAASPDVYRAMIHAQQLILEILISGSIPDDGSIGAALLMIDAACYKAKGIKQPLLLPQGNPPADETLLPCPFCRSTDLTLNNLVDDDDYFVSCNVCHIQQIANYTRSNAIELWNTRLPGEDNAR